mmetsp:Transcript_24684/g.72323  ORF Transcript_24684/g.72323 Transcript_24684/m.72323 type:complete len:180 (-) Transcript_24684:115-654(-)
MRILPALLTTAVPLVWRLSEPCSMATPDPFRPQRPPLEPLAINAIQELLVEGSSAVTVAQKAIEARANDPDYTLDAAEEAELRANIMQVGTARAPILSLLEGVVSATPWIEQFGMAPQFGMGNVSDPYVRLCRAECMLAVLLLHVEGAPVSFLDEERLEALRDAPTAEAVRDVRCALDR